MQTPSIQTDRPATSRRPKVKAATYSLAEFAAMLGIGYTVAHELVRKGELPVAPIRIGRQYRFPRAVVDRLLGIGEVAREE